MFAAAPTFVPLHSPTSPCHPYRLGPHGAESHHRRNHLIERDYFELSAANRTTVIAGVLAALEAEERFGMEFVGDPFRDEPESEKEGDE